MAVTVTTGKTHARFCRILLDGHNLSGDARQIQNVGLGYAEVDASAWLSGIEEMMHGRAQLNFGPLQALFNSRAAGTGPVNAGSYQALNGLDVKIGTLVVGIGEAPTIGAPAFSADLRHISAPLQVSDNAPVVIDANFSGVEAGMAGWGQILANGVSISSSTDFGSLDNGASSTGGFMAALHITQSAGTMGSNDWTFQLEHGANDSAWSNLGDPFALDGSAIGAELVVAAGTVNRYVRLSATKSGGTDVIVWLNFKRLGN